MNCRRVTFSANEISAITSCRIYAFPRNQYHVPFRIHGRRPLSNTSNLVAFTVAANMSDVNNRLSRMTPLLAMGSLPSPNCAGPRNERRQDDQSRHIRSAGRAKMCAVVARSVEVTDAMNPSDKQVSRHQPARALH